MTVIHADALDAPHRPRHLEPPEEVPTWPTRHDRRRIHKGMVLTVEPFLSTGGRLAREAGDGWTLLSHPSALALQDEHRVTATARGAEVLTLPG